MALPLPLPPESENSARHFLPTAAAAAHRPALRCTRGPRASAPLPAPARRKVSPACRRAARRGGGRAAAARRVLKFRFRSLARDAVISRPRALRQACVSRDALRSTFVFVSCQHGAATARRDRRTRTGGIPRLLRAWRVPAPPRCGASRRRDPCAMQQRHVRRRPVHAQRMLRAMGVRSARLHKVLREGEILVWEAETSESVDEEGLWLGVQGLRLPVRGRAFEEGSGLGSSGGDAGRWWEEAAAASSVGPRAGAAGGPHARLQHVLVGLVLASVSDLRALHQPYTCPYSCDYSGKEEFQAWDRVWQDSVRNFTYLFYLFRCF